MDTNKEQLPSHGCNWFKRSLTLIALVILSFGGAGAVFADEVTGWNQNTINAIRAARASSMVTLRTLAIEQAAVFDAVNGIERRFTHIYVKPEGPRGASSRAAATQAAYATLIRFFPSQKADLADQREASLAAITDESREQIRQGIEWGQKVADEILALRSRDGFDKEVQPFMGATAPGQWRPTPPENLVGLTPELASVTPFVMTSPSQFRPSGPPALTSAQYTAEFNEVKAFGCDTGSSRTGEQTQIGLFWNDNNHVHWNRIALYVAAHRSDRPAITLVDNARLFALLNLAMADASVVAWDTKYYYPWWRPITAIRLAGADGNDYTAPDAMWTPLQTTPNHPEYLSAHSATSGAAARVLANIFGANVSFTHGSDMLAGVTRAHTSFSAAAKEVGESRVFSGAHFRFSCNEGQKAGDALGVFVVANLARPNRDEAGN